MKKIWENIAGREGYEISNYGEIGSWITPGTAKTGRLRRTRFTKKLFKTKKGWYQVKFHHSETAFVRTLVMEAFHGPRPPGKVAKHISGSRSDNRAWKLFWAPPGGETHGAAKLDNKDVWTILQLLKNNESQSEIAAAFDVTRMTINRIARGDKWKVIYKKFNHRRAA